MWFYYRETLWGRIKDLWKYTLFPFYLLVLLTAMALIAFGVWLGEVI